MNLQIVSLIITIILAFVGYLITYLNNLRLSNRKEQLELVTKRINEFYGPLYVSSKAGEIAHQALLEKLGKTDKKDLFTIESPPSEKDLAEWRVWMGSVFLLLNEFREKLILENAHLIREEKMPEVLLQFVTHASAYRAMLKKWEMGNFSEYNPFVPFPIELTEYATKSYNELKAEQLKLIGKRKNRSKVAPASTGRVNSMGFRAGAREK